MDSKVDHNLYYDCAKPLQLLRPWSLQTCSRYCAIHLHLLLFGIKKKKKNFSLSKHRNNIYKKYIQAILHVVRNASVARFNDEVIHCIKHQTPFHGWGHNIITAICSRPRFCLYYTESRVLKAFLFAPQIHAACSVFFHLNTKSTYPLREPHRLNTIKVEENLKLLLQR